jgi:hypothetical protein
LFLYVISLACTRTTTTSIDFSLHYVSRMQKAPKLTPEEILFNGEENPLLRELAESFTKTTAPKWLSGVLPVTKQEVRLFFLNSDGDARSEASSFLLFDRA